MLVVLDASTVVHLGLAGESLGPLEGHELAAPPLLASEVTSALSELAFRGDIPYDVARTVVARLGGLAIRLERPADLSVRALEIARTLGWAKTYDAEYVALAQTLDCPLVTLDERLVRGAGHLISVIGPTQI